MEPIAVNEYPVVDSIRTHVFKFGSPSNTTPLILIIPGNPGCIEYYEEFMNQIHIKTGYPVWGISHAGQSVIPKSISWQAPDPSVFTLEGQISHKIDFVKTYIPADTEVILIGHSIGSYITLHMMERLPSSKVKEGILLFPTIERMATSPRGQQLTKLFKYGRWLIALIVAMLALLPTTWKKGLISYVFEQRRKYLRTTDVPKCIPNATLNLFSPYCVLNSLYMANIEMEKVVHLDASLIEKHLPRLRMYYGACDHWCPPEYFYDMTKLFPDHDKLEICIEGHRHAFIIDSSVPIADKVVEWVNAL